MKLFKSLAFAATAAFMSCQAPAPEVNITRNPYFQFKSSDSLRVRWNTEAEMQDPAIAWDGNTYKAYPVQHRLHTMYEAIVPINQETKSQYHVMSGKHKVSEAYMTNELMNQGEKIKFFAVGDIGEAVDRDGFPHKLSETLTGNQALQFGMLLGDIVYPVGASELYDSNLFGPLQNTFERIPVYTILGNHDYGSDIEQNYFQEWAKIGNGHWFHLDKGNTQIICLDSRNNHGFWEYETQKAWLEQTLKENKGKYKWTIIAVHHPGKSCTYKKVNEQLVAMYPIFNKYDVDVVINGHAHTYERLNPMDSEGMPMQLEDPNNITDNLENHFISITIGAGGKVHPKWHPENDECKFEGLVTKSIHAGHVGLFEIEGNTLNFKVQTYDHPEDDGFIWTKS